MRLDLERLERDAETAKTAQRMIQTHPDLALALIHRIQRLHKIVDYMMEQHGPKTYDDVPGTVCATCVDWNGERTKYPCSTRSPADLWLQQALDPDHVPLYPS